MLTRLARWWLARKIDRSGVTVTVTRVEECTHTGCPVPATHRIVATFDDGIEAEAGPGGGGTGMSADYCPDHCPGGCLEGCASMGA